MPQINEAQLRAELTAVLEDAIVGENLSPALVGRVKTAARALLHQRGLGQAQVGVRQEGAGFVVRVVLPPGVARVREVVLTVSGSPW